MTDLVCHKFGTHTLQFYCDYNMSMKEQENRNIWMLTKYFILVLTFIVDFNVKQRVGWGMDWTGGGVLNQRAVPGCDVMSVLSKTCSDISASCFVTSLEHFKHYRKRKERKNKEKRKKQWS